MSKFDKVIMKLMIFICAIEFIGSMIFVLSIIVSLGIAGWATLVCMLLAYVSLYSIIDMVKKLIGDKNENLRLDRIDL